MEPRPARRRPPRHHHGAARIAATVVAAGLRVARGVKIGPYRLEVVAPEVLAAIDVDDGLPERLATRRALLLARWGMLHVESVHPAAVEQWSAEHLLGLPRVEPHALRRVGKAADQHMARDRYGRGAVE